jgi:hypothetical protein
LNKKSKIKIPPRPAANAPQTADSMQTAAGLMGVDVSLLQFAKHKGSPGFTSSGRVHMDKVQVWLADNRELVNSRPTVTKEEMQIKLMCLKHERDTQAKERERFQFDVERGKYWLKEKIAGDLKQIASHQRAVLQRKLESELPPKLLGKDVTGTIEMMCAVTDEICRIFHDRTRQWES